MARLAAAAVLAAAAGPATGQVPAYRVQLQAPPALAQLLETNLELTRWRGNPRLDLEQLRRLVRAAPEQARTLVATEGYYNARVDAVLETAGPEPRVRVTVEPGEPVRVSALELQLQGFDAAGARFDGAALERSWSLPAGAVFRQADWEQAKRNLLRRATQSVFPRAQISDSRAVVDPASNSASLRVVLASGPAVALGALQVEGLQRYPRSIIEHLNPIQPGEDYSEQALQTLQARLQDSGYFSGVEVSADLAAADDDGSAAVSVPVRVRVQENKRKNVSVGVGYSTNTGNRAQLSYDDLQVLGLRVKSAITLETRRQSAHADAFFPTTAKGYNDSIGASFERNDLRGEVTSVSTLAAKRAWGGRELERSFTLEYLVESKKVAGQGAASVSQSVPLTYSITRRRLDSLLFPTDGIILHAQLGGALLPLLTETPFVRASTRVVRYQPLGSATTLIARLDAGGLASRGKAGVPATYLFRTGGDTTVRGYGYQQLGVQEGQAVVGGRYLLAASTELQHWLTPRWGAAVFVDAGNAGDVFSALRPKLGVGAGLRWRSPVGPINVDAAYGRALHQVRLHFSLGLTF